MIEQRNLAPSIPVVSDWTASGERTERGVGLRAILTSLDLAAVLAVWVSWVLVRLHQGWFPAVAGVAAGAATTLVALRVAGLYRARVCAVRSSEMVRTIVAALVGAAAFAVLEVALGEKTNSSVAEVALLAAAAIFVVRSWFGRWLKARRSSGRSLRTIVLVGANHDAAELWTTLSSEPELGYRVGAVIGPRREDAPWAHLPGSDSIGDVAILASAVGANGVILVGSALGKDGAAALAVAFDAGLHVQVWAGLPVDSRRLKMTPTLGVPLFYVEPQRSAATTPWALRAKRAIDVAGASLAGVAAIPILVVAALLIKLEDGGPIFYRAKRVGQFGRPITVLKLRTMVPDAANLLDKVTVLNERTDGPLFKSSNDPRTTRIGRLLRATSIDELPQLWNVLNGSMSLVGPRPAEPSEVEKFDDELHRRHQVRPGITGPWQLEARDNPSFNPYRRYDLAYVDSWSLGWDLAILCSTAGAVAARSLRAVFSLAATRRN